MMTSFRRPWVLLVAVVASMVVTPGSAVAQESKSAALAKELAQLLDQAKLDSVAAKDSGAPDQYFGALYFAGLQLLVVSAKYSVPELLDAKIVSKEYKDVYLDLNSASVPESKIFVEDMGANGLKATREENQPFDTYENGSKRVAFDGDWKKQKLSEDEYTKAFAAAEEKYAKMLAALVAELKGKPGS